MKLVEAGALAVNVVITLFFYSGQVGLFWDGAPYLTKLYQAGDTHFIVITSYMLIVAVLKTIMFYKIVVVFSEKRLKLSQPFNPALQRFIVLQAYIALGIGFFSQAAHQYSSGLVSQGYDRPDLQELHLAGADVWLFMAVVLFIIVQLVKRGIALQQENDLTI
ncbi:MAG: DUF2975 domain-containing protein [Chitinophagaceae bacterium]|nr:MAG: DUF2975 domain-containing protein [Chitinophagaceae bacterium]